MKKKACDWCSTTKSNCLKEAEFKEISEGKFLLCSECLDLLLESNLVSLVVKIK